MQRFLEDIDALTNETVPRWPANKFYIHIQSIIFVFTEVSFMDSSGIGMLLNRYKQVKRLGGNLYLTGCSKGILRIIKLSGLEKIVKITHSIDDIL